MAKPALAAARALQVLDYCAAHPRRPFTLSELSAALSISPASALSVLQALTDAGYLVRHPTHKTYELGPSLVASGQAALSRHRVLDLARAEMAALADDLRTECLASAVAGDRIVILATAGRPPLQAADVRVGQRLPLVPPLGQIFVAWEGQAAADAWLSRLDPRVRDRARPHLEAALAVVRRRGWSAGLDSDVRAELVGVLDELTEHPRSAALARRLDEVVARLGDDYELLDVEPRRTYRVATVVAPVFDGRGRVELALTLNGFPPVSGRDLVQHAERLVASARLLTKQNDGQPPDSGS